MHRNYENCSLDKHNDFMLCAHIHMDEFYKREDIHTDLSKTLEEEFRQSQYRCCMTTYLIVENGIIIKAFDKIKVADNTEQMLGELD